MARRSTRKTIGAVCLGLSLLAAAPLAIAVGDVLDTPARPTNLATENLLTDVAKAGNRIVAAGERGHIIYSDDGGVTWVQADVPVSMTLTAISFPTDTHGWAVGHSGVVLHSSDSGQTWSIQLDGIEAARISIAAKEEELEKMEARLESVPERDRENLEFAIDDLSFSLQNMESDLDVGPVNPMLDVWFADQNTGFVVGAYGMMFRTTDGGQTWSDWSLKLDNPTGYHLNAISPVTGGGMVIVGESGLVRVSADQGATWTARESPYTGSFFGVTGTGNINEVLAFGLRGNVFRSTDLGRSWKVVPSGTEATLNHGVYGEDGQVVLVGNNGAVLVSSNDGIAFRSYSRDARDGLMGVVMLPDNQLLLMGESGVSRADATGKNL